MEGGIARLEISYRDIDKENWTQLIDDNTFRHLLQKPTTHGKQVLNIKLEVSKNARFSDFTDPDEALSKLGVDGKLEDVPRFFPGTINIPEHDRDFEHCIEDLKSKLRGIGDVLKNEQSCREFISTVLLAAVLLVPGTRLDVETSVTGNEIQGRVDYSIFKGNRILVVCEAKASDMMKGTAMNLMQCNAALQQNTLKRKRVLEFDYIYGIITNAATWHYIRLTTEGEVHRMANTQFLPLATTAIGDDEKLRRSVKETLVTIAWMLQDLAQVGELSAKRQRFTKPELG